MAAVLRVRDNEGNYYDIPSIKGDKGKSAYEYAVDGGYQGTEEEFASLLGNVGGSGSPKVKVMSFPQMDGSDIYTGYNNKEIIGFIYDTVETSKNPLPENAIVVDVGIVLNDDTEIRKNQMCTDDYFGDAFVEIFNTPVYNPNYYYSVFRATDHSGAVFSQPILDIVQSDGYKHINVYYV